MLQHSLHLMQVLLEQDPTPTPTGGDAPDGTTIINTAGILTALGKVVVPILFAITGIVIMGRARRGRVSEVMTTSGISILGLCFIAGAPVFYLLAPKIVSLVLGN